MVGAATLGNAEAGLKKHPGRVAPSDGCENRVCCIQNEFGRWPGVRTAENGWLRHRGRCGRFTVSTALTNVMHPPRQITHNDLVNTDIVHSVFGLFTEKCKIGSGKKVELCIQKYAGICIIVVFVHPIFCNSDFLSDFL